MEPSKKPLIEALNKRESDYYRAVRTIESLLDHVDAPDEDREAWRVLREATDLVHCLRRLVADSHVGLHEVHAAFGAPGDFGYETIIGDALARAYGVRK